MSAVSMSARMTACRFGSPNPCNVGSRDAPIRRRRSRLGKALSSRHQHQRRFFNEAFDPHEIQVLEVVLENVRAAIGEPLKDPAAREIIAARIFNFAMRGERDPSKLYLRTLESYQAVPTPLFVKGAPGNIP